jgi:hypothetical protein
MISFDGITKPGTNPQLAKLNTVFFEQLKETLMPPTNFEILSKPKIFEQTNRTK